MDRDKLIRECAARISAEAILPNGEIDHDRTAKLVDEIFPDCEGWELHLILEYQQHERARRKAS